MFKMILMHIMDITASGHYLLKLPSNHVGEEDGYNWKII